MIRVPLWKSAFPQNKTEKKTLVQAFGQFAFEKFEPILIYFEHIWTNLSQFWQASSILDKFDPFWTSLI